MRRPLKPFLLAGFILLLIVASSNAKAGLDTEWPYAGLENYYWPENSSPPADSRVVGTWTGTTPAEYEQELTLAYELTLLPNGLGQMVVTPSTSQIEWCTARLMYAADGGMLALQQGLTRGFYGAETGSETEPLCIHEYACDACRSVSFDDSGPLPTHPYTLIGEDTMILSFIVDNDTRALTLHRTLTSSKAENKTEFEEPVPPALVTDTPPSFSQTPPTTSPVPEAEQQSPGTASLMPKEEAAIIQIIRQRDAFILANWSCDTKAHRINRTLAQKTLSFLPKVPDSQQYEPFTHPLICTNCQKLAKESYENYLKNENEPHNTINCVWFARSKMAWYLNVTDGASTKNIIEQGGDYGPYTISTPISKAKKWSSYTPESLMAAIGSLKPNDLLYFDVGQKTTDKNGKVKYVRNHTFMIDLYAGGNFYYTDNNEATAEVAKAQIEDRYPAQIEVIKRTPAELIKHFKDQSLNNYIIKVTLFTYHDTV